MSRSGHAGGAGPVKTARPGASKVPRAGNGAICRRCFCPALRLRAAGVCVCVCEVFEACLPSYYGTCNPQATRTCLQQAPLPGPDFANGLAVALGESTLAFAVAHFKLSQRWRSCGLSLVPTAAQAKGRKTLPGYALKVVAYFVI